MKPAREITPTLDSPLVVTGGGTGGHLYPALAVAQAVRSLHPDVPILFIGRAVENDRREVERYSLPFYGFAVEGLRRRLDGRNVVAMWRLLTALSGCLWLMRRYPRGVVFGVGGYVSAPAMLAGMILGWRVTLHEQNTVPGLVNRWLARWCDMVYLTYETTQDYMPHAHCETHGFPLRKALRDAFQEQSQGSENWQPHILVIGGSQGAKRVVEIVLQAFELLREKGVQFQATVQTGRLNFDWALGLPCPNTVSRVAYIDNMADAYRQADLIISRAGSGSLSEIALWGLPAILVPYPYASGDHQRKNAAYFAEQGAALVFEEHELSAERLAQEIQRLIENNLERANLARQMQAMGRRNAHETIAGDLISRLEG